jgi:MSHA biogenesis protein MshK
MARNAALLLLCMGFCSQALAQQPLPDPTRPAVLSGVRTGAPAEKQIARQWKLTSTLIAPQRRIAVINGRAVKVGEKIDGAELVGVQPGSALLHRAGRTIQLKLISGTVKQAAAPVP